MRRYLAALAAALVAMTASTLVATPAQATAYRDCPYPYVCLYTGTYSSGTKLAQYQDAVYQNMATNLRNQADSVVNTRNDDSVWLLDTLPSPDRYLCIPRNTRVNLGDYTNPDGGTWANDVDTIRIWGDPDDGKCGGSYTVKQGTVPDGWRG
ncbi:peptidase inhibitor family I36 protein [Catellatospora vulcania]|uniref:peptidase inhibitor family I36 protein n=1 Tax=Catellatospora vulcania TaxID=1460450 RepID=UPI001E2DDD33|nr:peptidase inhibitor family I36 protein [Catellatospora vulcania]